MCDASSFKAFGGVGWQTFRPCVSINNAISFRHSAKVEIDNHHKDNAKIMNGVYKGAPTIQLKRALWTCKNEVLKIKLCKKGEQRSKIPQ